MRILTLLIFSITLLSAHPHCFIDVYPAVDGKKLTVKWVFDQMSSQMLVMDFDRDRDGQFSDAESAAVYKEGFESLREYGYYTKFFSGGAPLATGQAEGFRAAIDGFRVQYRFALSLPEGATSVRFYDEENYSAFVVEEDFVREANPGKTYKVREFEGDMGVGYILELK
jgi:ABC-type uncharacterized transport system substrate-binding protein